MLLLSLLACGAPDRHDPASDADTHPEADADVDADVDADTDTLGVPATAPIAGTTGFRPRVDVLVIGAGVAGLSAAVEAWRDGADVRILERTDGVGGSANWASGLMIFSGSPEQANSGVTDSPEQLLAEWPEITGGDPEDPWVRYFAENNVARVHDWLSEMGVRWTPPRPDPSAGTTSRVHEVTTSGSGLATAIEAQLPDGAIVYEAEAERLLRDRHGRVTGVRWTDLASGTEHVLYAGAVIVATGGFMHDLERVRNERPDLAGDDLRYGSWPGADGNGLAMLEAEGAATQNLDVIGLYAHGAPAPGDGLEEGVAQFVSRSLWFNADGERFVDESTINSFRTGSLRAAQRDGDAWMLFDSVTASTASFMRMTDGFPMFDLGDLEDAGLVVQGDDVAAVADALGVDANALKDEAAAFNAFADGAGTDRFRTDPSQVNPITRAPIYALPLAITVAKGFGGVDVDLQGRVLDTSGQVIPGLYAAGELTGMAGGSLVGDAGFTGSLTAVVLGGRVAGENAAAE